jgi:hypothetical protein
MNPEDIFKSLSDDNQLRTAQAKLGAALLAGDSLASTLRIICELPSMDPLVKTIIEHNIARWEDATKRSTDA